jgi:hypothetical protein
LKVQPDFDSTMRRFESSRPSHIAVRFCSQASVSCRKVLKRHHQTLRSGVWTFEFDRWKPPNLTVCLAVYWTLAE